MPQRRADHSIVKMYPGVALPRLQFFNSLLDSRPCHKDVVYKQGPEVFNNNLWAGSTANGEINEHRHSTSVRTTAPHGLPAQVAM